MITLFSLRSIKKCLQPKQLILINSICYRETDFFSRTVITIYLCMYTDDILLMKKTMCIKGPFSSALKGLKTKMNLYMEQFTHILN